MQDLTTYHVGCLGSKLRADFLDSEGNPADITGHTIAFSFLSPDGTEVGPLEGTIEDAAYGEASYTIEADDGVANAVGVWRYIATAAQATTTRVFTRSRTFYVAPASPALPEYG